MNYLQLELKELLKTNSDVQKYLDNPNSKGYWVWNLENPDDQWYNDDFWHTLDISIPPEDKTSSFWKEVMIDEDVAYCFENLKNHLKNPEKEFEQLVRYTNNQEEIIWMKCLGKTLCNKEGIPTRMVGITLRKNRVQSLQDYNNLLEHSNEAATIGHWEIFIDSKKAYWSKITKKIYEVPDNYEVSLEEALKLFNDSASLELVQESLEKATSYDIETKITTYNNTEKWVRAIGIPVMQNGKCIEIYGLLQDINEDVKKREELSLKEELFRNTFEGASIGMALVSLEGKWLRVNQSLCDMLGYSKNEFYTLNFQNITHPADLDIDLKKVNNLIKGNGNNYQLEKRYFHKNGDIVYALLAVSIIRDKDNIPLHFVSQITDLSVQKHAYKRIESLLEITQNQNKRLLNFAHIVSHNLRSHSGNLSMLLDLMKIEMPSQTKNDFFTMINQAVDNLGETIKHLNEVILLHTKQRDDIKKLNLKKFIDNALTSLKGQIIEHNVTIENEVKEDTYINYVPAYMDSILINLISNAIKYKEPSREPFIKIKVTKTDTHIILLVSDNGIGINLTSNKSKLFGMYKTFHPHPEAKGIGLFITKNQVEAMEGKIDVESTLGIGSTFKVYFKK
ncbi:hypothetical protein NBRC110019_01900 [Neptunitalea chrysea]|uniref:histidine kinase n=1 Tax=Neptunitalea chrysea TaxID=1647581 RepID=A0A9W6B2I6_9FLAO|nr:PAS domain-containing protein [Neptunitalea chrysea]GLB51151.1 hypothetical protein NBRC110019_01900 [Neptunitalea chrysea]